jgi:hypothetical protein
MHLYKVKFDNNKVVSCKEMSPDTPMQSSHYYEHNEGQLVYAVLKAVSKEDAKAKALEIVREVNELVKGTGTER